VNPAARREGDTLILCYHAISGRWPAALAITLAQLREQLEWLLARGYRGVTFSEAVTSQRSWPAVAITFDDAFSSVLDQAFPVMASLGLPGTVFVVTDFGDSGRPLEWPGIDHWAAGEHRAELRGMTWPQLRSLEQVGWEVGSHSLTHPHLTKLGDDALAHELRESRAACERALGHPVASIAYPCGDVDDRAPRTPRCWPISPAAGCAPSCRRCVRRCMAVLTACTRCGSDRSVGRRDHSDVRGPYTLYRDHAIAAGARDGDEGIGVTGITPLWSTRRTGWPTYDQLCPCATTIGTRHSRPKSVPQRLEPNMWACRTSIRSRRRILIRRRKASRSKRPERAMST